MPKKRPAPPKPPEPEAPPPPAPNNNPPPAENGSSGRQELQVRLVDPGKLKIHPEMNRIPPALDDQKEEIFKSIAQRRQIDEPLRVLAGSNVVIDGRIRLDGALAAQLVVVPILDVHFQNDDDPVLYMYRSARLRRHLTDDQRACMAAEEAGYLAELGKQRQKEQGSRGQEGAQGKKKNTPGATSAPGGSGRSTRAAVQAAEHHQVKEHKVRTAQQLKKEAPEEFEEVKKGEKSLLEARQKQKKKAKQKAPAAPVLAGATPAVERLTRRCGPIILGDCVVELAKLPLGEARLIFAEPPDLYPGQHPNIYRDWSRSWLSVCLPLLTPDGSLWILADDDEAFAYYRHEGVPRVVCQEKHMGSRAVVVVGRDEEAIRRRFGVVDDGVGICYTRTGRRFFDDRKLEGQFLDLVRSALNSAGFWEEFKSDWFCLDCELMPWSAKAQELLRLQYAAVGAASRSALHEVCGLLDQATHRDASVEPLRTRYRERADLADRFTDAYRRYCWPVASVADLKLAPFHLLASEGAVHVQRDHAWHMDKLSRLCGTGTGLLLPTAWQAVDLTDAASEASATDWYSTLTARGGEGMVVKPLEFVTRGRRGVAQPAVKCRGPEYLRIIYGPDYSVPENLDRLRKRGLGAKRSLALREFALGVEALERFVRREPLRRVHECVFGVLALESEPADPRL